jgi:hypothetical protein
MPEESTTPGLAGLVRGFASAPNDLEPMLKLFAHAAIARAFAYQDFDEARAAAERLAVERA